MAERQGDSLLPYLRRVAGRDDANVTDRDLLTLFAVRRDEAAFGALVRRHGPMVWGVCRRVLGRHHDVEDAFQATFLVLARRAGAMAWRESVGCWLHGVARRVALKTRTRNTRVPPTAPHPEPVAHADPLQTLTGRELLQTLDEELARLPDHLRAPLILCCLEGKSRDEAARQLGWSPGSVKGRLERGRALLARRLARRGLCLSAALAAALLARPASAAELPPVTPGTASPAGTALADAVCRSLVVHRFVAATATLLVVAAIGWGTWAAAARPGPEPESPAVVTPPARVEPPPSPPAELPLTLQADLRSVDVSRRTLTAVPRLGGDDVEGPAREVTLRLADDAVVLDRTQPVALADLKRGSRLALTLTADGQTVTAITVVAPRKGGKPEGRDAKEARTPGRPDG